jgi:hypothetical protein
MDPSNIPLPDDLMDGELVTDAPRPRVYAHIVFDQRAHPISAM